MNQRTLPYNQFLDRLDRLVGKACVTISLFPNYLVGTPWQPFRGVIYSGYLEGFDENPSAGRLRADNVSVAFDFQPENTYGIDTSVENLRLLVMLPGTVFDGTDDYHRKTMLWIEADV